MMLFVGKFVNNSFTFSVLYWNFHLSCFLREANVVLFSDLILLISTFIFFLTWVNICICDFIVYRSFSCCLWFEVSVWCLGYCIRSRLICLLIYLFEDILYFKVRKLIILGYCPNQVSEPLLCSLKSSEFCPDFYHSFSVPFFIVTPKKTV